MAKGYKWVKRCHGPGHRRVRRKGEAGPSYTPPDPKSTSSQQKAAAAAVAAAYGRPSDGSWRW